MDEELESFKREIKLHEYAASLGFEVDRKESSKREIIMRRGGDKIAIRVDIADGHHVYYSFRDPGDNGTIINFHESRTGEHNFGRIRKQLRTFAGNERITVYEPLEP